MGRRRAGSGFIFLIVRRRQLLLAELVLAAGRQPRYHRHRRLVRLAALGQAFRPVEPSGLAVVAVAGTSQGS